jgi:hypothetical protein
MSNPSAPVDRKALTSTTGIEVNDVARLTISRFLRCL